MAGISAGKRQGAGRNQSEGRQHGGLAGGSGGDSVGKLPHQVVCPPSSREGIPSDPCFDPDAHPKDARIGWGRRRKGWGFGREDQEKSDGDHEECLSRVLAVEGLQKVC